jgi:hypothetical protein
MVITGVAPTLCVVRQLDVVHHHLREEEKEKKNQDKEKWFERPHSGSF